MSSSILTSAGYTGLSADVKMHLLLDGEILSVGQLGPDFLILDTAIDHPPSTARLFFAVDGNERQWNVHLPQGISADSRRVVIAAAG
jgi:hypothetical protein